MSNSTEVSAPNILHERLAELVATYHGLLCADERRLREAMLEYERSCGGAHLAHAA